MAAAATRFETIMHAFPRGRSLPADDRRRRHVGILLLLAAHAVGLPIYGLAMGATPWHVVLEGGLIALIALVAWAPRLPPRAQTVIASFGLMSCSAILTHLSGGYIEAHFHFFVMLGVIFLYEDWLPYVLSVGYVAVHHGVAGTLDPRSVFNHAGAIANPWAWAGIHALFVFGLSAALVVAWNVIARSRESEFTAREEARGLRRQLHMHEKMAALGSLAAGLAHEVRTPLTVVAANAALIERHVQRGAPTDRAKDDVVAHVREINASVDRMNALVLQLKRFHDLGRTQRESTPLDDAVKEAVDLFLVANRAAPPVRLDLRSKAHAQVSVLGLQQIVLNLVANAVDAVDRTTGKVTVSTFDDEHGAPQLVVADNGAGMTPEVKARAFEPLFTTKTHGSGLGLSIVQRIAADHAATIDCATAPRIGTTFRVRFAAAPAALGARHAHDDSTQRPTKLTADAPQASLRG